MRARAGDRTPAAPRPTLLLVDDDPLIAESLDFLLSRDYRVYCADSRAGAMALLRGGDAPPDLALVDLGLPPAPHSPEGGFALIDELIAFSPDLKVLVLSGQSDRANVAHALSLGAVDFIPKPCDPALLQARLGHQMMILEAERARAAAPVSTQLLLGDSPAMRDLRAQVARFADTPFPVLIHGESGTGKELVAQALHQLSTRASRPYLTLNCAAFTPDLLEAQLFGHARGAFTGAASARAGFFEDAGEGTLFLDEIGEFPLELQPKLLRVLENGDFYRIGETRARTAAARIVAATNRNLQNEIREGRFRQDLFHRLGVLSIEAPALRDRGRDRLLLLSHFRDLYANKVAPFTLDEAAERRWLEYSFPGNVRELRNIMIRLGAKYPGARVGLTALEAELDSASERVDIDTMKAIGSGSFRLDEILNGWEQRYIEAALRLADGNLSEAARLLGVNRTTLYGKIERLSKEKGGDV